MWFRIIITAAGLAAVLYFQFFFDFKAYTNEVAQATSDSPQQQFKK